MGSPRRTPEPYGRASPDAGRRRGSISNLVDRRNSLSERRGSLGIPARKFTPGKSPLASPNHTKMYSSSPRSNETQTSNDLRVRLVDSPWEEELSPIRDEVPW